MQLNFLCTRRCSCWCCCCCPYHTNIKITFECVVDPQLNTHTHTHTQRQREEREGMCSGVFGAVCGTCLAARKSVQLLQLRTNTEPVTAPQYNTQSLKHSNCKKLHKHTNNCCCSHITLCVCVCVCVSHLMVSISVTVQFVRFCKRKSPQPLT